MADENAIRDAYKAAEELLCELVEWAAGRRNHNQFEETEIEIDGVRIPDVGIIPFGNVDELHSVKLPTWLSRIEAVCSQVPELPLNGWIRFPAGSRNYLDGVRRIGIKAAQEVREAETRCFRHGSDRPMDSLQETLSEWLHPESDALLKVLSFLDRECERVRAMGDVTASENKTAHRSDWKRLRTAEACSALGGVSRDTLKRRSQNNPDEIQKLKRGFWLVNPEFIVD